MRIGQPCIQAESDSARFHPLLCITRQRLAQFWQNAVARMNQYDAQVPWSQVGIIGQNPVRKVVQGPRELDARETPPAITNVRSVRRSAGSGSRSARSNISMT